MAEARFHIKGLNELRACAAFAVVIHHIEQYKKTSNIHSLFNYNFLSGFIGHLGENGVFLFFVLSGFLITLLLLKEKKKTDKISIKRFYVRRILRIWPLYYLIIALSFFLLPSLCLKIFPQFFSLEKYYQGLMVQLNNHFSIVLVLYILFLPNLVGLVMHNTPIPGVSHLWSIGVEEQFYVIWPWIVNYAGKFLIYFFVGILVFKLLCNYYFGQMSTAELGKFSWLLKFIILNLKIEFMALGGIAAYFLHENNKYFLALLKNKLVAYTVLLLMIYLLIFPASSILISLCFTFLISNIAICGILLFENKNLNALGNFSFGIYMYHPIIMFFCYTAINKFGIENVIFYNLLVYVFIIGITVAISYLSYKYFEKPFLKYKEKFALLKSG